MASPYHGASSSYETSLPDPPAKRMAPASDFVEARQHGENSVAGVGSYSVGASNGMGRDAANANAPQVPAYMAQRQGSRDMSHSADSNSYSYALNAGIGATSVASPFTMLQHPAFQDIGTRDAHSDVNGAQRAKQEELSVQRYPQSTAYGVMGPSSSSIEANERLLPPNELLPPSTYSQGDQTQTSSSQPPAFAPMQGSSTHYPGYAMPQHYHPYTGHMYPPQMANAMASSSSSGIVDPAHHHAMHHAQTLHAGNNHPSSNNNGPHNAAQTSSPTPQQGNSSPSSPSHSPLPNFSHPLRRPEFTAPLHRNMLMPRRHSIAVPSPGHHYGLWPHSGAHPSMGLSGLGSDPMDWPLTSRQSSHFDDTGSNMGADDGSDSDGGEGTTMVSLRPKEMPPGGPVIDGKYMSLLVGPGEHQVKDFNILPINILRINYDSKSSDYIVVHLLCDVKMKRATRDIFMTAISAHHLTHDNKRAVLPALKISQQMLRGRTKGFLFQLKYTLVVDGHELETLHSEPFYLWSNVSQRSFPRHEREAYAMETQDINTRKRRRK